MSDPAIKYDTHYTYGDYKSWPDDERWELIEGVAYEMAGPNQTHQSISMYLSANIYNHIKARGNPCKVYAAPFDVLLPRGEEEDDLVDSVVQPDILVYCDLSRITYAGSRKAPDFIAEILSPWTSKKDLNEKFRLYEKHGVREYWVVDPGNRWVMAYRLAEAKNADGLLVKTFDKGTLFQFEAVAKSSVLEGFEAPLSELFGGS